MTIKFIIAGFTINSCKASELGRTTGLVDIGPFKRCITKGSAVREDELEDLSFRVINVSTALGNHPVAEIGPNYDDEIVDKPACQLIKHLAKKYALDELDFEPIKITYDTEEEVVTSWEFVTVASKETKPSKKEKAKYRTNLKNVPNYGIF